MGLQKYFLSLNCFFKISSPFSLSLSVHACFWWAWGRHMSELCVVYISHWCIDGLVTLTAYYLPQNAGAIARKYIKDPELLSFIDAEVQHPSFVLIRSCNILIAKKFQPDWRISRIIPLRCLQCFIVSTVNALQTPMINASMVRLLVGCLPFLPLAVALLPHVPLCTRYFVTGILGVLTILLVALVELQSPWQMGWLNMAVIYNTGQMWLISS